MQWTGDRNGGFSRCDPARLYLPVLLDPVYGHQAVNVEAEMRNSTSLLWWTKRMIEVRKQHPVFGLGSFEELTASNPSVFAFLRQDERQTVLCVNNLSRFPQPVELDLRRFAGCSPVEVVGRVHFPRIGEWPYLLTLAGYGSYWFELIAEEG
jgi:maltose alpha-D-glucosyltransferase/alpha-amylase